MSEPNSGPPHREGVAPLVTPEPTLGRELAVVRQALLEIDTVAQGIKELATKFGGVVFDVTTSKGMEEARAARAAVREPRYKVEKVRKEAKRPILDLGKKLDAEAARITNELLAIEEPIHQQIKAEEDRKEAEKEARAHAERDRIAAIHARIQAIRDQATVDFSDTAASIEQRYEVVKATVIDDSFEELKLMAEEARGSALTKLQAQLEAARAREAEAARLEKEREEVEAQRKADEARRVLLSEIESIRQQAMIAMLGRAGMRRGGTIECIRETLAETENWPIDPEKFGDLAESAERAKRVTIESIREQLVAFEQRLEQDRIAAERQKELDRQEEEARAARQVEEAKLEAERQRIAEEERLAREARAAEEARLADERAEFERQKQAEHDRAEAEERAKREAEEAERRSEEEAKKLAQRSKYPGDDAIVSVLTAHFNVPDNVVQKWLTKHFGMRGHAEAGEAAA